MLPGVCACTFLLLVPTLNSVRDVSTSASVADVSTPPVLICSNKDAALSSSGVGESSDCRVWCDADSVGVEREYELAPKLPFANDVKRPEEFCDALSLALALAPRWSVGT